MFLSHYGTPTKDLPMRLNPGDLILVHSNALLPQTVRISTRSKVTITFEVYKLITLYILLTWSVVGPCCHGNSRKEL